ncbi:hypothetical protein [Pseudoalteromonas luteoviolacea]|uniref:Uncharacterized protein n=1 Tax=Pseudoalteromonas luteoviolacea NCIMB 1942 TaxID=1365253 RepID=A0A167END4_9GAMM|nr:hypothetical protein [Pseudoalteromonas luteoviolacea]KZN50997.1 hypothetical protein N482_06185 [Pseudoalteromonas luteoviolacea NCIMB 1942]KZX01899.1 hypothetical protein JL49_02770 [Pseudoalteromonas luteoviolacea]
MGDLFLKQRENWWVWIVWGVIGLLSSKLLLSMLDNTWWSLLAPITILIILTAWMNFNRRFDFIRALKILMLVGTISLIPLFEQRWSSWDQMIHIAVESGTLLISLLTVSIVCALLAKRPKQYY